MGHGVRLFVGGDAASVQRRRVNVTGDRCFTAAHAPRARLFPEEAAHVRGLLDSGAFTDSPERRLSPAEALGRQLRWEGRAAKKWGVPWQAEALVSYDMLIDEVWTGRQRFKRRWTVAEADRAVRVTVEAASYLASRRRDLEPRRLVMACQGVDAAQYTDCVRGVLEYARPGDTLGLGGWCILGWFRTWIPVFWETCHRVLPLIRDAGLDSCHLFGVLYRPVLGGLLWLCDRHGLSLSTDSAGPVLRSTRKNPVRAGAVCTTWEENVIFWRDVLASLRESNYYREPPGISTGRQLTLFA